MDYDPSLIALTEPERRGVIADFGPAWPLDAQCAELARLAYFRFEAAQKAELVAALRGAGFTTVATFDNGRADAQAFATIRADGTIFVTFRGTQPKRFRDLSADLGFLLRPWAGAGRVHRGFLVAYSSLGPAIDAWLGRQPRGRLVVTGHSLGAAMATIMAALHREAELVTFGSPLVGNYRFAAQFSDRPVRRYVDCCDWVTRVPPALLYRHVAGERYIDRHGTVLPDPPDAPARAEDRRAAGTVYAEKCRAWGNVPVRGLADHAPINYVSALLNRRVGP